MPLELFSYISELDRTLKFKSDATKPEDYCTQAAVEEALRVCVSQQLQVTMKKILGSQENKKTISNFSHALDIVKTTEVHIKFMAYKLMCNKIKELKDENLKGHFVNMSILAGLHFVKQHLNNGFDAGYFKKGADAHIEEAYKIMLG